MKKAFFDALIVFDWYDKICHKFIIKLKLLRPKRKRQTYFDGFPWISEI